MPQPEPVVVAPPPPPKPNYDGAYSGTITQVGGLNGCPRLLTITLMVRGNQFGFTLTSGVDLSASVDDSGKFDADNKTFRGSVRIYGQIQGGSLLGRIAGPNCTFDMRFQK